MLDAVRRLLLGSLLVFAAIATMILGACAGGSYAQGGRRGSEVNRGETNGRRFDFVSNKPEFTDWQIRLTGNSMWVGFSTDAASDKLGSINLTDDETSKVWTLIDAIDIPNRKRGKKDEDEGYVSLQLKDPGDEGPDVKVVYVSRATEDANVIALAKYLQDLTEKYKGERPNF
jgi:hypothetical protein